MVWKMAILPTAKQLHPRRRQSSCSTECLSITVISRRVYAHRDCQHLAGRSLHHKVAETTIQAHSEPLYTVFLCYSLLFSSPMMFIPDFTRWFRRSFHFQPSPKEEAFFRAEVVHHDLPDRPTTTCEEILLDHLD